MKGPVVALFFLAAMAWPQANPAELPHQELILTNVNVVDTRDGGVLRNMTVVIRDGRIQAVAKLGLIGAGRKIHVVNASGKYLIPGLWDMLARDLAGTASGWTDATLYSLDIANGVTGLRETGARRDLLQQENNRIQLGTVLGPHLMASEDFATTRTALRSIGKTLQADADAPEQNSSTSSKALSHTSGHFLPSETSGRKPISTGTRTIEDQPAAMWRSVDHLDGMLVACSSQEPQLRAEFNRAMEANDAALYAAAKMKAIATYDSRKAHDFFTRLAIQGTWQVPALVWSQTAADTSYQTSSANHSLSLGARMPDLQMPDLHMKDAQVKYVPLSARDGWEAETALHRLPVEQQAAQQEANWSLQVVGNMRSAGLQFLAGTGAPAAYVIPGFALHEELEWLVKSGFSPLQALQAATFNPALFMAMLDRYGVVEKGRVADLVLLNANPLDDIRNTRRIAAVVVGGEYHSREDLDKMLAQVSDLQESSKPTYR